MTFSRDVSYALGGWKVGALVQRCNMAAQVFATGFPPMTSIGVNQ